eukprot:365783-Chlamydomonas_euryale.AAC.3
MPHLNDCCVQKEGTATRATWAAWATRASWAAWATWATRGRECAATSCQPQTTTMDILFKALAQLPNSDCLTAIARLATHTLADAWALLREVAVSKLADARDHDVVAVDAAVNLAGDYPDLGVNGAHL